MAPPLGSARPNVLFLRVVSAAVLAPTAIAAAWFGGASLAALTLVAAALMGWEWARLTQDGRLGAFGVLVVATEIAGVGAAAFGFPRAGTLLVLAGAFIAAAVPQGIATGTRVWTAMGVLWIGIPSIALLWIASDPELGRATVLWLFPLVWAIDSAAYVAGRTIGGPRLAPRWSPKKTWSGAAGGIAAAAAVGAIAARVLGISVLSPVLWTSLGLAVVEQLGDLAESAAKRRFGVKDTSGLIPGHGGFLDRLDGMLAVLAVTALLMLLRGRSPLAWG
jgi:phosphatidate cytidylyltransferase